MIRLWVLVLLVSVPSIASAQDADPSAWGWGPQLGFIDNNLGGDLIDPADVSIDDDGVVQLAGDENALPLVLLGVHRVLWRVGEVGVGIGLVVAPGDNLFEAAGGGLVVEFKGDDDRLGFTMGVGAIKKFSTFRLADGWTRGQHAPSTNLRNAVFESDETFLGFWTGAGF